MTPIVDVLRRSRALKLGAALILIAAAALAFAAYRMGEVRALASEGILVEGEVLEKLTDRVRRSSGGVSRYDTVWNLRYRFQPATGDPVEAVREVPRKVWDSLEAGGPVGVRYLPDAPSRHQIVGSERKDDALAFMVGGGVFGLAGIALMLGSAVTAAQTARLLAHGVEREAEVVAIDKQLAKRGTPDCWRVKYSYTDETGTAHTRTTGPSQPGTPAPQVGARIAVLVDPSRPQRSRWTREL